jgi:type IV pilus assembly protein PilV
MIEVLVSLVIIAFGLLGLAGLQTRLQLSEFEAYQRSQALLLLDDMASRINTNRINAAAYTGDDVGVGTCPATPATTRVEADLQDWCNALQGAGETQATNKLGAMLGGRGCVEQLASAFSDGGGVSGFLCLRRGNESVTSLSLGPCQAAGGAPG